MITTLGLEAGQIRSTTAAALVGAGMVSIVVYPLLGAAALGRDRLPVPAVEPEPDSEPDSEEVRSDPAR